MEEIERRADAGRVPGEQAIASNALRRVAVDDRIVAETVEFSGERTREPVIADVRALSPRYERDRPLSSDIRAIQQLVLDGHFVAGARSVLPSLG